MHAATPRAQNTPALEFQVDPPASHREITDPQDLLVVTPPAAVSTARTNGCFFRRLSWMMRAYRSPKTPSNLALATKPGKVNKAQIDLGLFIASRSPKTKPLSGTGKKGKSSMAANSYNRFTLEFTHTITR